MTGVYFPNIGPTFVAVLSRAESSIMGTAYCFDHAEGCNVLRRKRQQGVEVRIILDGGMWKSPSCKTQPQRIKELLREGAQIKTLDLEHRQTKYAILHAKTWCVDGLTYLGGSANFTNNACHSEENLLIIRDPQFLADYMNWFETLVELRRVLCRAP